MYIIMPVYGLIVGSFIGVCIGRVPAGEDIIRAPSRCPDCGRRLTPFELIPVFSWLALRGKCRGCGVRISPRYPLIELANGLLWLLCARCFATLPAIITAALALSLLLAVAVTDGQTGRIPDGYCIALAVLAAANLFVTRAPFDALPGAVVLSLPLFAVYQISGGRAIGGGDIKFLAATGLLLGWKLILLAFAIACVIATAIHGVRVLKQNASHKLRLGPYMAVGVAIAMFVGDRVVAWYVGLLTMYN